MSVLYVSLFLAKGTPPYAHRCTACDQWGEDSAGMTCGTAKRIGIDRSNIGGPNFKFSGNDVEVTFGDSMYG